MYAWRAGHAGRSMRFEALDFLYEADVVAQEVRLRMKDPVDFRPGLRLETSFGTVSGSFINTGSPHLAVIVPDLGGVDVQSQGRQLRFHDLLAPAGANVNFVAVQDRSTIAIRTYERGVEAETLACGTGSVASAAVCSLLGKTAPPVTVKVRSGGSLRVAFDNRGGQITNVTLQGSAHMLFAGKVLYDSASCNIALPVRPM